MKKENIKIFQTGNFNNINHTLEHLQDAIQAQKDFKDSFLPNLKLTHEDTKTERDNKYKAFENYPFILGSADNFVLNGNELFCDFTDVFEALETAVDNKLLRTHSIEAYYNIKFKESDKNYKMMITAVSFLPCGELPALVEVFKPYMYNLDSNNTDMENNQELQPVTVQLNNFNIDDFSYEKKLIYKIGEKRTMDKLVYENMIKPFASKGVQCMGYDEFMALTAEQQAAYLAEMASKLDEVLNKVAEEENKEMVKTSFSQGLTKNDLVNIVKDIVENQNKNVDATKELFKIKANSDNQVLELQNLVKELKDNEKRKEVTDFVHKFSKSDKPSLPIANEEMAIEILMAVSNDSKTKFSVDNNKLGLETLVRNFISSLPAIESKTTREVFKTKEGLEINNTIRADYPEDESDSDIALDLKVQKYALEHKVSYEQAYSICK